ncbi:MAG TPA: 50S ribosomal protein L6 [Candidatus Woesearchaeota archaeon]|nr:50S ribosomal protein L6 [Candidatus Woesearchaeota archaeon]
MEEKLVLPEGVTAKIEDRMVVVSGKLGEVKKPLFHQSLKTEVRDNAIVFSSKQEGRNSKRMIKTYTAHAKNMIKGVQEGFIYNLKLVYTHFPATMKLEGNKLRIENFIGERKSRVATILPGVEVKVQKQDVEIKGIDLYNVSQTAGNIEQASRIVDRDRRVFQDGIFITNKGK